MYRHRVFKQATFQEVVNRQLILDVELGSQDSKDFVPMANADRFAGYLAQRRQIEQNALDTLRHLCV